MSKNRPAWLRLIVRSIVVAALLGSLFSFASYSPQAAGITMSYVELAGVNGGQNNVVFAFDRYVLIAPYAPKGPVEENGDLGQLDNHFLYLIDTKKPGVVLKKDLTAFASSDSPRTIYYPTKLTFDSATQIVFVRGTRFEEQAGEVEAIEVIAYLHLNLGDNGKPISDSTVVSFDIQGVGAEVHSSDAPTDIALGANGNHLVFTNGASIFTYSIDQGYLYKVDLVHPSEYGPNNFISYLAIDQDSSVLTVYSNRKVSDKENVPHDQSEISFYKLIGDGTLTLLKRAYPEDLPQGAFLTPGSNIVVYSEIEKPFAIFLTSDGSLCQVDLHTDGLSASVRQLVVFPELAQQSADDTSPRLVKYDPAKRVVGIVTQGYVAQIGRPGNGRKGRIGRPGNVHVLTSQPMLAMARFGKKSKVASRNVFSEDFSDEGGLSELLSVKDNGEWLMATYSGKLLSITTAGDFEESSPLLIDSIAPRIARLDYLTSRESLVAVQSCSPDDEGTQAWQPGSVAVGKLISINGKSFFATATSLTAFSSSPVLRQAPAIRRPGNFKR
ncbi:MAG TPA: hypothetical protein VNS63_19180 [Blastocatellia bacterium]|nr:hypothetical protein [Blastocatellia bacterium]